VTPDESVVLRVIALLNQHGIPFMVTGSIATSYHGRPRSTHDADLVIDPRPPQLAALVSDLLAEDFHVSPEGAQRALQHRAQFNVIAIREAAKVDLIIRKDRPFSVEEFRRRQLGSFAGTSVPFVTPEDAILSKLEWARRGGDSERQIADAAGVLQLNPSLDRAYVARWAAELGVTDLWTRIERDTAT
jgi:hypothetical protein